MLPAIRPLTVKIFSYKGRMGRAQFAFIFLSALLVLSAAFYLLGRAIAGLDFEGIGGTTRVFIIAFESTAVWALVWVLSASWVKRLHDLDVSGWYQLILFVPYINYLMLIVLFLPGTSGRNKYGDAP
jgi:uncharacterized membrane protein YhaH (DUF805 family)